MSRTPGTDASTVGRITELVSRVPVLAVAVAAGAGIATFVALGILQRVVFGGWGFANLDSEVSVATRFSAARVWVAAFWWLLVAQAARPRSLAIWGWGAVLAWLALDEGSAVHERLERWSGVDWQIVYSPFMGLAAVALWGVFRRYRSQGRVAVLLLAGAASWIVVLALELIQNWGGSAAPATVYVPTMIAEEALEMIGSAAFLLAAMLILRQILRPSLERGA